MYPLLRLVLEARRARRMAPLALGDAHVTHLHCLPGDIDPWRELNNGRTLTLYDMGRVGLGLRSGLSAALREQGWGMAVAGASVRYRKRIRLFDRIEMHSRAVGWDARFLYMEQSLWARDEAASQVLIRAAVTGRDGIVPPARLAEAMGLPPESPALPRWVAAWIEAEGERPWPPERPDRPAEE